MFRSHALRVVLFKAPRVEVPRFVFALLHRSLQRLAAASWMALPVRRTESLDTPQLPSRPPCVSDACGAALVRRAMAHKEETTRANNYMSAALSEDNAFFVPPLRGASPCDGATHLGGVPRSSRGLTRTTLASSAVWSGPLTVPIVRSARSTSCIPWLLAARWVAQNDVDELAKRFRIAAMRAYPIELCISMWTAFLYSWCTSARFKVSWFGHGSLDVEGRHMSRAHSDSIVLPPGSFGLVCSHTPWAQVLHRFGLAFGCADEGGRWAPRAFSARPLAARLGHARQQNSVLRAESLVLARLKETRRPLPGIRNRALGGRSGSSSPLARRGARLRSRFARSRADGRGPSVGHSWVPQQDAYLSAPTWQIRWWSSCWELVFDVRVPRDICGDKSRPGLSNMERG